LIKGLAGPMGPGVRRGRLRVQAMRPGSLQRRDAGAGARHPTGWCSHAVRQVELAGSTGAAPGGAGLTAGGHPGCHCAMGEVDSAAGRRRRHNHTGRPRGPPWSGWRPVAKVDPCGSHGDSSGAGGRRRCIARQVRCPARVQRVPQCRPALAGSRSARIGCSRAGPGVPAAGPPCGFSRLNGLPRCAVFSAPCRAGRRPAAPASSPGIHGAGPRPGRGCQAPQRSAADRPPQDCPPPAPGSSPR
jgi:hypothetical protein